MNREQFKNDWRNQGQEEYLLNKNLKFIGFNAEKTDHEHCNFCWDKISNYPNTIHKAYCTIDERYWICPQCYSDFKELFNWRMDKSYS